MRTTHRLLAAALVMLLALSALSLSAAAEQDGDHFGWYGWIDGESVWIEADVGPNPGQWQSVPLKIEDGTEVGWVWFKSAPADAAEESPDRVDVRFGVYDSYLEVPSAGESDDSAYCVATLPAGICNLYESEDGDDYGVKNFAIVFAEGDCFSQYLSYYANAFNSYEEYVASNGSDYFAQAGFDGENYQLTWDSLRDNRPGYVQITANIQTQDPAHEKTLLDNNLLQLTVTGYHNTRNAVMTLPLSDYAQVDRDREITVAVIEGEDPDFDPAAVTLSEADGVVTADFGDCLLKDGVTYALRVPVEPAEPGLQMALAAASPWLELPVNVNDGATLQFAYDLSQAGRLKTAEYYEEPLMRIPRTDAGTVRVQFDWADGGAHSGDSVTLELLQNGKAVASAELNGENGFGGVFSVTGNSGTLSVRAARVLVQGKDVTERYSFEKTVTAVDGAWSPVSVAEVENAKSENRLYAMSYGLDGTEYLFTNQGSTMTAVLLSSAPILVENERFTPADLADSLGGDGLAAWNHMQWMVLADNAYANCVRLYNLATERYLSLDSLSSAYTFSMTRSADGVSVRLTTDAGAAEGKAFLKMYVNSSMNNWGYFRAQTLPVPTSVNPWGYALSTQLADRAAQFRFWTYSPEELSWTVTGQADQTEEPAPFRFDDVLNPEQYDYEPVYWALDRGVTKGSSATEFSPDQACARAQIVTFLWRAEGSPKPDSTQGSFQDLREDAYYYQAVLWAAENGITTGTGKGVFSPAAPCTRAQIATFLWRAAGSPVPTQSDCPFEDVPADAWYRDAVLWALETGLTRGTTAASFSPNLICSRAQAVTFLCRACGA